MPITQVDLDNAQSLVDELLDNKDAAEAYSKDPVGWLETNGYANVNPEAVAQCGASAGAGAGGAVASASASASASAGAAGVAAQLNPIVYNNYIEDNSITNNIVANGDVTIDNTVQSVDGDGNVLQDDVNVGGDQQVQTGDGIQGIGGDGGGGFLGGGGGDGVDISGSNVATGDDNQQAIDNSDNAPEAPLDLPERIEPLDPPEAEIPPFG